MKETLHEKKQTGKESDDSNKERKETDAYVQPNHGSYTKRIDMFHSIPY